ESVYEAGKTVNGRRRRRRPQRRKERKEKNIRLVSFALFAPLRQLRYSRSGHLANTGAIREYSGAVPHKLRRNVHGQARVDGGRVSGGGGTGGGGRRWGGLDAVPRGQWLGCRGVGQHACIVHR